MKLVTATEDDAIVVAYQIKADMLMKIPNNKAAREAAIVACEWIEDSWKRDGSPHFTATAKCWSKVREALERMPDY
jgi:hypothetical protein